MSLFEASIAEKHLPLKSLLLQGVAASAGYAFFGVHDDKNSESGDETLEKRDDTDASQTDDRTQAEASASALEAAGGNPSASLASSSLAPDASERV